MEESMKRKEGEIEKKWKEYKRNIGKRWARDGPGFWGIYREFMGNLSGTGAL